METLFEFDRWLFLLLNGLHNPSFDDAMEAISNRFMWVPLYAVLTYVVIRKFRISSIYILIGVALMITFSDQVSFHLFKNTIQRLRPCHDPSLEGLVHLVNGHCGGRYGFISNHAANSFALAWFVGMLFYRESKYYLYGLFGWACLVCYSRIYLGVHYPLDLISGAVFGILVAIFIMNVLRYFDRRFSLNIFAK